MGSGGARALKGIKLPSPFGNGGRGFELRRLDSDSSTSRPWILTCDSYSQLLVFELTLLNFEFDTGCPETDSGGWNWYGWDVEHRLAAGHP